MTERITWLKRDLSTLELLALGYSDVSSTYYFTLGIVALNSGSLLPITMLLGSLSLWLVGLAYAEFGSAIPRTGGAYYYIRRELGNTWGFIAGWLLSFDQILMIAYGALGAVNYLNVMIPLASRWPVNSILSILVIIMIMTINILGIKASARFNLTLLTIDLLGILILLMFGYYLVVSHGAVMPRLVFNYDYLIHGLTYSFRGYTGIDVIAQSTGEALTPYISVPRAIIGVSSLSTAVALLLSLLTILSGALTVVSNNVGDPIGALARYLFHNMYLSAYISMSIAIVLLISVNAGIVDFSRSIYVMSEDGLLPGRLSSVHGRYRTPHLAIIISSLIAILFVIPGSVELIADSYAIASTIVYLMTMIALIIFRNKESHLVRYFRIPGITIKRVEVPIVSIIGTIIYTFSIMLIILIKAMYMLVVLSWLLIGMLLYLFNRSSRRT
ncbi:APC family permease [Vulcanisaeta distributa]|uniref:Amino acid permease-associated region n=1 Tax=Vulcanisaeta distributa (strain DSM 14429 / JCM 11212 / NBRC 100878 / IC-017) TaxID=572478 RepID=E1QQ12_VULDI|nr:APC family permease [Vulcanisaeta distributa]ADN50384.1 amino acid permease-associated region [Vulcanisaeta distributa DSM 14429]